MNTDNGARVCDPQQFQSRNQDNTAAAHRVALQNYFSIRVHLCPSVVENFVAGFRFSDLGLARYRFNDFNTPLTI
jgi:hypothetical protein